MTEKELDMERKKKIENVFCLFVLIELEYKHFEIKTCDVCFIVLYFGLKCHSMTTFCFCFNFMVVLFIKRQQSYLTRANAAAHFE